MQIFYFMTTNQFEEKNASSYEAFSLPYSQKYKTFTPPPSPFYFVHFTLFVLQDQGISSRLL